MLCCKNCIINPICLIGCENLSKNINLITIKDFGRCTKLSKRLISIITNKTFHLELENYMTVEVDKIKCNFIKNGELHREDGPSIECINGDKHWYINGELHREDGPAVEFVDGTKEWFKNGKRHREDGPAIEYSDIIKLWYKNGKFIKEEEYANQKRN